VISIVLLFGSVMFAVTVSMIALSVAFAFTSIMSLMLYVLPAEGAMSFTSGITLSSTLKFVLTLWLMLLLVSFAIIVML